MKIDRQKAKCKGTQPPADVQNLIRELLLSALQGYNALAQRLSSIKVWKYSKSDFYYWHDIVDLFDEILADATAPAIRSAAAAVGVNVQQSQQPDAAAVVEQPLPNSASHLYMRIDEPQHESLRKVVCEILHFFSLLIENTFSRSSFSSIDRLFQLLFSDNLHVVYNVLVLLYTFARRSNLFGRLQDKQKRDINAVLHMLASPWNTSGVAAAGGFTLATCCSERQQLPPSATTVIFQGTATTSKPQQQLFSNEQQLSAPIISSDSTRQFNIDSNICSESNLPTAHIMQNLLSSVNVSLDEVDEKQLQKLFQQVRLAKHFCTHEMRIMNVQVRLQALTVLLHNSALTLPKRFLYNGFLEELVDILKLDEDDLADIKTCVLRTLTAIIHYYSADSESLNSVLQATGLASPYGTIPTIVRECVDYLTRTDTANSKSGDAAAAAAAGARRFPVQYTTAIFSFLYHISSSSNGVEALTNADIMQVMLRIINHYFIDTTTTTAAATAVTTPTIIISTTNDTQTGGSTVVTDAAAAPSSALLPSTMPLVSNEESLGFATRAVRVVDLLANNNLQMFRNADGFACMTARLAHEVKCCLQEEAAAAALKAAVAAGAVTPSAAAAHTCHPQRAALMKSALSFLKKAFPDAAFNDNASLRDVFGEDTRNALKCIIERSDFFGPSLFLMTLDVITSFISSEPASLSDFQASGLSQAILNAVFVKKLPTTREILSSLPQTCTSLCTNSRGVEEFRAVAPFQRICHILLSEEYMPALRRKKNANSMDSRQRELTQQLGGTIEQLAQNHPVLRADAGKAVVAMLNKLVDMGNAVYTAGSLNIMMPGSNIINTHAVQTKLSTDSIPAVTCSSSHELISPSASAFATSGINLLPLGANAGNSASSSAAGSTIDLNIALLNAAAAQQQQQQSQQLSRQSVVTVNGVAAMLGDDPGLGLRHNESVQSLGGNAVDLIDFDREDDSESTSTPTFSPMAGAAVGGLVHLSDEITINPAVNLESAEAVLNPSAGLAATLSAVASGSGAGFINGINGVGNNVIDAEMLDQSSSTAHAAEAAAAESSTSGNADAVVVAAAPAMNGHASISNIDATMVDAAAAASNQQQSTTTVRPENFAGNTFSTALPYYQQQYQPQAVATTTNSVVLQSTLTEMLLNVAYFTDSFLSNTNMRLEATSRNVADFAANNGLQAVIDMLKLNNVALDFSMSGACNALGKLVRTIYNGWNLQQPSSSNNNNNSNKILDDIISSLQTLTSEALVCMRQQNNNSAASSNAANSSSSSVSSGQHSALVNELAAVRAFSLASLSNNSSSKLKLDGFAANSYAAALATISQQTCCPLVQKLSHIHTHIYVLSMLCKSNTRQISSSNANNNISTVLVQNTSMPQLAAQLVTFYNMLVWESIVLVSQSDSTQSSSSSSITPAAVMPFPPSAVAGTTATTLPIAVSASSSTDSCSLLSLRNVASCGSSGVPLSSQPSLSQVTTTNSDIGGTDIGSSASNAAAAPFVLPFSIGGILGETPLAASTPVVTSAQQQNAPTPSQNSTLLDDAINMRVSQLLSTAATTINAAAAVSTDADTSNNNIKQIARATTNGDVAKLVQPTLALVTKLSCALSDLLLQVIRMPYSQMQQRHRRNRLGAIQQSQNMAQANDRLLKSIAGAMKQALMWLPHGCTEQQQPNSNNNHAEQRRINDMRYLYLACTVTLMGKMLVSEYRQAFGDTLRAFIQTGTMEVFFKLYWWFINQHKLQLVAAADDENMIISEQPQQPPPLPPPTTPPNLSSAQLEFLAHWLELAAQLANRRVVTDTAQSIQAATSPTTGGSSSSSRTSAEQQLRQQVAHNRDALLYMHKFILPIMVQFYGNTTAFCLLPSPIPAHYFTLLRAVLNSSDFVTSHLALSPNNIPFATGAEHNAALVENMLVSHEASTSSSSAVAGGRSGSTLPALMEMADGASSISTAAGGEPQTAAASSSSTVAPPPPPPQLLPPPPPVNVEQERQNAVTAVAEMGFDRPTAIRALLLNEWQVESAVNLLLQLGASQLQAVADDDDELMDAIERYSIVPPPPPPPLPAYMGGGTYATNQSSATSADLNALHGGNPMYMLTGSNPLMPVSSEIRETTAQVQTNLAETDYKGLKSDVVPLINVMSMLVGNLAAASASSSSSAAAAAGGMQTSPSPNDLLSAAGGCVTAAGVNGGPAVQAPSAKQFARLCASDIVIRVVDIVQLCARQNGAEWRENLITLVVERIVEQIDTVAKEFRALVDGNCGGAGVEPDWLVAAIRDYELSVMSAKLEANMHFAALLLERCSGKPYWHVLLSAARADLYRQFHQALTTLISTACYVLQQVKPGSAAAPQWLTLAFMLLNTADRQCLAHQRTEYIRQKCCTSGRWKHFDARTMRWLPFDEQQNESINKAFNEARNDAQIMFDASSSSRTAPPTSNVPFSTIYFDRMVMVNHRYNNARRPVMREIDGFDSAYFAAKKSAIDENQTPTTTAVKQTASVPGSLNKTNSGSGAVNSGGSLQKKRQKSSSDSSMQSQQPSPATRRAKALKRAHTGSSRSARKCSGNNNNAAAGSNSAAATSTSANISARNTKSASKLPSSSQSKQAARARAAAIDSSDTASQKSATSAQQQQSLMDAFGPPYNISSLTADEQQSMLLNSVELIKCGASPQLLEAILRYVLRLTRSPANAVFFVKSGGLRAVIALPAASYFPSLMALLTLIVRHVIEQPHVLAKRMSELVEFTLSSIQSKMISTNATSPASAAELNSELFLALARLWPMAVRAPYYAEQAIKQLLNVTALPGSNSTSSSDPSSSASVIEEKLLITPPNKSSRSIGGASAATAVNSLSVPSSNYSSLHRATTSASGKLHASASSQDLHALSAADAVAGAAAAGAAPSAAELSAHDALVRGVVEDLLSLLIIRRGNNSKNSLAPIANAVHDGNAMLTDAMRPYATVTPTNFNNSNNSNVQSPRILSRSNVLDLFVPMVQQYPLVLTHIANAVVIESSGGAPARVSTISQQQQPHTAAGENAKTTGDSSTSNNKMLEDSATTSMEHDHNNNVTDNNCTIINSDGEKITSIVTYILANLLPERGDMAARADLANLAAQERYAATVAPAAGVAGNNNMASGTVSAMPPAAAATTRPAVAGATTSSAGAPPPPPPPPHSAPPGTNADSTTNNNAGQFSSSEWLDAADAFNAATAAAAAEPFEDCSTSVQYLFRAIAAAAEEMAPSALYRIIEDIHKLLASLAQQLLLCNGTTSSSDADDNADAKKFSDSNNNSNAMIVDGDDSVMQLESSSNKPLMPLISHSKAAKALTASITVQKLKALCHVLSIMMASAQTDHHNNNDPSKNRRMLSKQTRNAASNIIARLLVKAGVARNLGRLLTYCNLNSTNFAQLANALLKPIELLSFQAVLTLASPTPHAPAQRSVCDAVAPKTPSASLSTPNRSGSGRTRRGGEAVQTLEPVASSVATAAATAAAVSTVAGGIDILNDSIISDLDATSEDDEDIGGGAGGDVRIPSGENNFSTTRTATATFRTRRRGHHHDSNGGRTQEIEVVLVGDPNNGDGSGGLGGGSASQDADLMVAAINAAVQHAMRADDTDDDEEEEDDDDDGGEDADEEHDDDVDDENDDNDDTNDDDETALVAEAERTANAANNVNEIAMDFEQQNAVAAGEHVAGAAADAATASSNAAAGTAATAAVVAGQQRRRRVRHLAGTDADDENVEDMEDDDDAEHHHAAAAAAANETGGGEEEEDHADDDDDNDDDDDDDDIDESDDDDENDDDGGEEEEEPSEDANSFGVVEAAEVDEYGADEDDDESADDYEDIHEDENHSYASEYDEGEDDDDDDDDVDEDDDGGGAANGGVGVNHEAYQAELAVVRNVSDLYFEQQDFNALDMEIHELLSSLQHQQQYLNTLAEGIGYPQRALGGPAGIAAGRRGPIVVPASSDHSMAGLLNAMTHAGVAGNRRMVQMARRTGEPVQFSDFFVDPTAAAAAAAAAGGQRVRMLMPSNSHHHHHQHSGSSHHHAPQMPLYHPLLAVGAGANHVENSSDGAGGAAELGMMMMPAAAARFDITNTPMLMRGSADGGGSYFTGPNNTTVQVRSSQALPPAIAQAITPNLLRMAAAEGSASGVVPGTNSHVRVELVSLGGGRAAANRVPSSNATTAPAAAVGSAGPTSSSSSTLRPLQMFQQLAINGGGGAAAGTSAAGAGVDDANRRLVSEPAAGAAQQLTTQQQQLSVNNNDAEQEEQQRAATTVSAVMRMLGYTPSASSPLAAAAAASAVLSGHGGGSAVIHVNGLGGGAGGVPYGVVNPTPDVMSADAAMLDYGMMRPISRGGWLRHPANAAQTALMSAMNAGFASHAAGYGGFVDRDAYDANFAAAAAAVGMIPPTPSAGGGGTAAVVASNSNTTVGGGAGGGANAADSAASYAAAVEQAARNFPSALQDLFYAAPLPQSSLSSNIATSGVSAAVQQPPPQLQMPNVRIAGPNSVNTARSATLDRRVAAVAAVAAAAARQQQQLQQHAQQQQQHRHRQIVNIPLNNRFSTNSTTTTTNAAAAAAATASAAAATNAALRDAAANSAAGNVAASSTTTTTRPTPPPVVLSKLRRSVLCSLLRAWAEVGVVCDTYEHLAAIEMLRPLLAMYIIQDKLEFNRRVLTSAVEKAKAEEQAATAAAAAAAAAASAATTTMPAAVVTVSNDSEDSSNVVEMQQQNEGGDSSETTATAATQTVSANDSASSYAGVDALAASAQQPEIFTRPSGFESFTGNSSSTDAAAASAYAEFENSLASEQPTWPVVAPGSSSNSNTNNAPAANAGAVLPGLLSDADLDAISAVQRALEDQNDMQPHDPNAIVNALSAAFAAHAADDMVHIDDSEDGDDDDENVGGDDDDDDGGDDDDDGFLDDGFRILLSQPPTAATGESNSAAGQLLALPPLSSSSVIDAPLTTGDANRDADARQQHAATAAAAVPPTVVSDFADDDAEMLAAATLSLETNETLPPDDEVNMLQLQQQQQQQQEQQMLSQNVVMQNLVQAMLAAAAAAQQQPAAASSTGMLPMPVDPNQIAANINFMPLPPPPPTAAAVTISNDPVSSASFSGTTISSDSAVQQLVALENAATSNADGSSSATAAPPTQNAANAAPAASSSSTSNLEDDLPDELPEAFLRELPEDVRNELVRQHRRAVRLRDERRIRQQQQQQQQQFNTAAALIAGSSSTAAADAGATSSSSSAAVANIMPDVSEVDLEILALLPAEIQEEIMAQQRASQSVRQNVAAAAAAAAAGGSSSSAAADNAAAVAAGNSNDQAEFFSTLAPQLRRQILIEMDDSQVTTLPENLRAERDTLRRSQPRRMVGHEEMMARLEAEHAVTARARHAAHLNGDNSGALHPLAAAAAAAGIGGDGGSRQRRHAAGGTLGPNAPFPTNAAGSSSSHSSANQTLLAMLNPVNAAAVARLLDDGIITMYDFHAWLANHAGSRVVTDYVSNSSSISTVTVEAPPMLSIAQQPEGAALQQQPQAEQQRAERNNLTNSAVVAANASTSATVPPTTTILPSTLLKPVFGRQVFDLEGMTCLIVMLTACSLRGSSSSSSENLDLCRLHRVLKNLCLHGPTRQFVVSSLLSLLNKCAQTTAGSASSAQPPLKLKWLSLQSKNNSGDNSTANTTTTTTAGRGGAGDGRASSTIYGSGGDANNNAADSANAASSSNLPVPTPATTLFIICNPLENNGLAFKPTASAEALFSLNPDAVSSLCQLLLSTLHFLGMNFPDALLPYVIMRTHDIQTYAVNRGVAPALLQTTAATTSSSITSSNNSGMQFLSPAKPSAGRQHSASSSRRGTRPSTAATADRANAIAATSINTINDTANFDAQQLKPQTFWDVALRIELGHHHLTQSTPDSNTTVVAQQQLEQSTVLVPQIPRQLALLVREQVQQQATAPPATPTTTTSDFQQQQRPLFIAPAAPHVAASTATSSSSSASSSRPMSASKTSFVAKSMPAADSVTFVDPAVIEASAVAPTSSSTTTALVPFKFPLVQTVSMANSPLAGIVRLLNLPLAQSNIEVAETMLRTCKALFSSLKQREIVIPIRASALAAYFEQSRRLLPPATVRPTAVAANSSTDKAVQKPSSSNTTSNSVQTDQNNSNAAAAPSNNNNAADAQQLSTENTASAAASGDITLQPQAPTEPPQPQPTESLAAVLTQPAALTTLPEASPQQQVVIAPAPVQQQQSSPPISSFKNLNALLKHYKCESLPARMIPTFLYGPAGGGVDNVARHECFSTIVSAYAARRVKSAIVHNSQRARKALLSKEDVNGGNDCCQQLVVSELECLVEPFGLHSNSNLPTKPTEDEAVDVNVQQKDECYAVLNELVNNTLNLKSYATRAIMCVKRDDAYSNSSAMRALLLDAELVEDIVSKATDNFTTNVLRGYVDRETNNNKTTTTSDVHGKCSAQSLLACLQLELQQSHEISTTLTQVMQCLHRQQQSPASNNSTNSCGAGLIDACAILGRACEKLGFGARATSLQLLLSLLIETSLNEVVNDLQQLNVEVSKRLTEKQQDSIKNAAAAGSNSSDGSLNARREQPTPVPGGGAAPAAAGVWARLNTNRGGGGNGGGGGAGNAAGGANGPPACQFSFKVISKLTSKNSVQLGVYSLLKATLQCRSKFFSSRQAYDVYYALPNTTVNSLLGKIINDYVLYVEKALHDACNAVVAAEETAVAAANKQITTGGGEPMDVDTTAADAVSDSTLMQSRHQQQQEVSVAADTGGESATVVAGAAEPNSAPPPPAATVQPQQPARQQPAAPVAAAPSNNNNNNNSFIIEAPAIETLPQLHVMQRMWETLSETLTNLETLGDIGSALLLLPLIEAFFLLYAPQPASVLLGGTITSALVEQFTASNPWLTASSSFGGANGGGGGRRGGGAGGHNNYNNYAQMLHHHQHHHHAMMQHQAAHAHHHHHHMLNPFASLMPHSLQTAIRSGGPPLGHGPGPVAVSISGGAAAGADNSAAQFLFGHYQTQSVGGAAGSMPHHHHFGMVTSMPSRRAVGGAGMQRHMRHDGSSAAAAAGGGTAAAGSAIASSFVTDNSFRPFFGGLTSSVAVASTTTSGVNIAVSGGGGGGSASQQQHHQPQQNSAALFDNAMPIDDHFPSFSQQGEILNAAAAAAVPVAASSQQQNQEASTPAVAQAVSTVAAANAVNKMLPIYTRENMLTLLTFAERHKTIINEILRYSSLHITDSPFAVLISLTRVLDFDVKRRFFRQQLDMVERASNRGVGRSINRFADVILRVRRDNVFEDSFRDLHRRGPDGWRSRFYIVFENEEGQDAGGLLREWYSIMAREIFNPMYGLFKTSPSDRATYSINAGSHINTNHLQYFKFVGRFIAKAILDNKLLECFFTRSFYKHMLDKPVRDTDMESEDPEFYQGLLFLLTHTIGELGYDLTFSTEVQEYGVTKIEDLKTNGRNLAVTNQNKDEYVQLVCQTKMTHAIKDQLASFLEGFYELIPRNLISMFNEQELELLISGLPNIDIEDLRNNTDYHRYDSASPQIIWFWQALRSFQQEERAKFLQFVTGTSKVPLQGFAALEGMNGTQKLQIFRDDRGNDRLPCAHTCFNQLDLPPYETYDRLRQMLLYAVNECSEGFGFA